jgi:hypothetical protein
MNDIITIADDKDDRIKPPSHPVIVLDNDYPCVVLDGETVRFWCELDEDFCPERLSWWPYTTAVDFELDAVGLPDVLSIHGIDDAVALGLTYRQPFYVEVGCHYHRSGSWEYPDEWDCETTVDILHVKSLSDQEIEARFQEWLNRK